LMCKQKDVKRKVYWCTTTVPLENGSPETRCGMWSGAPYDVEAAKAKFFELLFKRYKNPELRISYPGALELVKACRAAGLKVAVASSADKVKVFLASKRHRSIFASRIRWFFAMLAAT
jgi:hypothetical protein